MSDPIIVRKRYVGAAKIRPDSLTPRRLPIAISAMKNRHIGTRSSCNAGTAAMIADTPAETETATVRT